MASRVHPDGQQDGLGGPSVEPHVQEAWPESGGSAAGGTPRTAPPAPAGVPEDLGAPRAVNEGDMGFVEATEKANADVMPPMPEGRADADANDDGGDAGLVEAALKGHADDVPPLLEGRADVHAQGDDGGEMGLMEATEKGHADVHAQGDDGGDMGLVEAAEKGNVDVVQRLLEGRADVNAKNEDGNTGLTCAALNGHADIVQRLLEGRADINAKTEDGNTGLTCAALNGHADIVQRLLKGRADINAKNNNGVTGLIRAALNGHADIVQRLLEGRADINAKSDRGWTGLILAAKGGHVDLVQRLLEGRADVDAKNFIGHTAMRELCTNVEPVVRYLEAEGDPRAGDLHIQAVKMGHVFAKDLLKHCFRDVSEETDKDGKKLLKPLGSARRSTEGPRPWDAEWEAEGSKRGELGKKMKRSNWLIERPAAARHGRDVTSNTDGVPIAHHVTDGFFKHVTDGVPIAHKITKKPGLLRKELVDALAGANARADVFALSETHAILNAIWESRCRWLYLLEYGSEITLACLAISSAVDVRHDGKTTVSKSISMAMILSKSLLNELAQLWTLWTNRPQVSSLTDQLFIIRFIQFLFWMYGIARHIARQVYVNASDYACLGISVYGWSIAAFAQDLRGDGHEFELGVLAVWVFTVMMSSVMGVRAFTPFGPRMLPIMNSIIDVKEFALISGAVLAAFTMAYYILCTRDAPADDGLLVSSPLYAAFVHMFRLGVLGDFDLFELEGVDPTYATEGDGTLSPVDPPPTPKYVMVHVVFFGTALVCTVMLMNLLVGILGGSYDRFEDQSIELFLRQRARIIAGMGGIPWYRRLIWPSHWEEEDFWYTVRKDPADEDMRSVRAVIKQELSKAVEQMDKTMESRLKQEAVRRSGQHGPLHEHPLASTDRATNWICDGCGKNGNTMVNRYRCTEGCNFDLCDDCYVPPQVQRSSEAKLDEKIEALMEVQRSSEAKLDEKIEALMEVQRENFEALMKACQASTSAATRT